MPRVADPPAATVIELTDKQQNGNDQRVQRIRKDDQKTPEKASGQKKVNRNEEG